MFGYRIFFIQYYKHLNDDYIILLIFRQLIEDAIIQKLLLIFFKLIYRRFLD